MNDRGRLSFLAFGLVLGGLMAGFWVGKGKPALAATDHGEEYILCTGAVAADVKRSAVFNPSSQSYRYHREQIPYDGVWLLDCRAGKLRGTVIDRSAGKVNGWAEVDLGPEFGILPHQAVHFMMTTGSVSPEQAALYVAETTSGQLGVYTLAPIATAAAGAVICRHDHGPVPPTPEERVGNRE